MNTKKRTIKTASESLKDAKAVYAADGERIQFVLCRPTAGGRYEYLAGGPQHKEVWWVPGVFDDYIIKVDHPRYFYGPDFNTAACDVDIEGTIVRVFVGGGLI